MATVNIKLNSVCMGGEHLQIAANLNGQPNKVLHTAMGNMTETISDDEFEKFINVYLKIFSNGKNKTKIRDDLLIGLVVTI